MPGSEEVSVFLNISFNVSFIFQALPLNVDIMGTVISRFLNPEKGNLEQKRVVVFFFNVIETSRSNGFGKEHRQSDGLLIV